MNNTKVQLVKRITQLINNKLSFIYHLTNKQQDYRYQSLTQVQVDITSLTSKYNYNNYSIILHFTFIDRNLETLNNFN